MPEENLRKTGNEMEDVAAAYLQERGEKPQKLSERQSRRGSAGVLISICMKKESILSER